jgi:hypothetical protein
VANENPAVGASGNETPEPNVTETPNPAAGAPAVVADWIPEALRGNKTLAKFKTAGDAAQAYVNLEKTLGNRVEIPGDNATPEQRDAFYTRLGRPAKAEDYEAPAIPEGSEAQLDADYATQFRSKAHELNLTKAQAKGLQDWVIAREVAKYSEFAQQTEAAKKEAMAKLRAGWGAAADQNVGLVQRLVSEYGDDEAVAELDRTGAGNSPAILRMMAKIARSQVEGDIMPAADLGTSQKQAQQDIEATKNAAAADRKHPYRDSDHPGHRAEVARMRRLYEIAYPDTTFAPEGL